MKFLKYPLVGILLFLPVSGFCNYAQLFAGIEGTYLKAALNSTVKSNLSPQNSNFKKSGFGVYFGEYFQKHAGIQIAYAKTSKIRLDQNNTLGLSHITVDILARLGLQKFLKMPLNLIATLGIGRLKTKIEGPCCSGINTQAHIKPRAGIGLEWPLNTHFATRFMLEIQKGNAVVSPITASRVGLVYLF